MNKFKDNTVFSQLYTLNPANISSTPNNPSLYMICKKDASGNNQVVFAGVTYNIKHDLLKHFNENNLPEDLYFCYLSTSPKNVSKNSKNPLYQRVA